MGILRFESWCQNAVSDIRDRADRERVYGELYAHMEDQYEELLDAGFPEKDAENEVAEAMGDPGETALQLARIHRPFWGYALRAARWGRFCRRTALPRLFPGRGAGDRGSLPSFQRRFCCVSSAPAPSRSRICPHPSAG